MSERMDGGEEREEENGEARDKMTLPKHMEVRSWPGFQPLCHASCSSHSGINL